MVQQYEENKKELMQNKEAKTRRLPQQGVHVRWGRKKKEFHIGFKF